jgi:hypothetical protein
MMHSASPNSGEFGYVLAVLSREMSASGDASYMVESASGDASYMVESASGDASYNLADRTIAAGGGVGS